MVSMHSVFVIFLGTEAYYTRMKVHFHGEFVCMWTSCEHMFSMRSLRLHGVTTNEPMSRNMLPVIQQLQFCLQLLNSVWDGMHDL